ncbi:MAG: hypothetical protein PQJ46_11100 [Spirochaetales bacterium]|nr:hypothetical protein [Spirochaetales bacterium]
MTSDKVQIPKIEYAKSKNNGLKKFYCSIIMSTLGWFIPKIACRRSGVIDELKYFPDKSFFTFGVLSNGPSVTFQKVGDKVKKIKKADSSQTILSVYLKSIEAAWLMFTFQESTCQSEANGRLAISGELPYACAFIRFMNKVEILLLPKFIAKKAVKNWVRVK